MLRPLPGTVLIEVGLAPAWKLTQRVLLGVLVVPFVLGPVLLGVLALAAMDATVQVRLLALLVGLMVGAVWAGILAQAWWATSVGLTVTTAGIQLRNQFRRHWVPWAEVARIEPAEGWFFRQATVVVTTAGRRRIARITAHRYVLLRGEPYDELSRDPSFPGRPTAAAIRAHQDHLAGRFPAA